MHRLAQRWPVLLLAAALGCGGTDGLPQASTPDPNLAADPARVAPNQPKLRKPVPPPFSPQAAPP